MPEARIRRKALVAAPQTPLSLPALFADDPPTRTAPLPQRRTRHSASRKAAKRVDEFNYFDAPRRTDISLAAPQACIDFPARDAIPDHWEYACARGILASTGSPVPFARKAPCRACEEHIRRKDFFSAALHHACVRAASAPEEQAVLQCDAAAHSGDADSPHRTRPGLRGSTRGSGGTEEGYECGHLGCSYHCSIRQAVEEGEESGEPSADVTGSDRSLTKLTARIASMPQSGIAPPLLPPYKARAKLQEEDIYNGDVNMHQAALGYDHQAVPWENLQISREDYRATRLRSGEIAHGENPDRIRSDLGAEPRRHAEFFNFFSNTRRVKCSIVHFQLRNLCYATSKHDVCVMNDMAVLHWNSAARRKSVVLDLSGSSLTVRDNLPMVQISTIFAIDDLVIAGGFFGEVVVKSLSTGKVVHNHRVSLDENSITNAIDKFGNNLMMSNNDCYVRTYDLTTWQRLSEYRLNTAVNHATRQPGGKLVCAVGDDTLVQLIDGDNGDRVANLRGHEDFSFATAWHPDGRYFATGSQDRTCRIWDVRNMSQTMRVIGAKTGSVRSLRFSSSGKHLMIAEQKDFVHVYDSRGGTFDTVQEIDMFGEIGGVSFSPNGDGLWIAISDKLYSSLMEYEINRSSKFVYGSLP